VTNKTFIFDYDDTLAPNQQYYCYAQIRFAKYIIDKFNYRAPDVQSIINEEVEVDLKNVKTFGFSAKRFPNSFVETFKKICESRKFEYTEDDIDDVYSIGTEAFDIDAGLVENAESVLNFLAKKNDELLLYTKGDEGVQRFKIALNNMKRWFKEENIFIVNEKNCQDFKNIIGTRNKESVYKVGNSVRSDIKPAIEAGIKAIYIPCETWAYERDHKGFDLNDSSIITIDSIKDIIEIYDRL
jgi:putative hydrolase of the HAD superfamily